MTYSDMDLFEYYEYLTFYLANREISKAEIEDMMPFERYIISDGIIRHKEKLNK